MQDVGNRQDRAQWPLEQATSRVEEIISHAEGAAEGILGAAEQEAERYVREVCRESEREALEHAKALSGLSDSLIAHAEVLSRQSGMILEQLSELAGSTGNFDGKQGAEQPVRPAMQAEHESRGPEPSTAPAPVPTAIGNSTAAHGDSPATYEETGRPHPVSGHSGESAVASEPYGGPAMAPVATDARRESSADRGQSIAERYSAGARLLATQMAVAGSDRNEIRRRLIDDFEVHDPEALLDAIMGTD